MKDRTPAPKQTPARNIATPNSAKPGPTKLINQTAMVTEAPTVRLIPPPARNVIARATTMPRMPAMSAVYRVGVGDVLDIRVVNMPTRESTLFTVLKGGMVEHPLIRGPIQVSGLTTDEIARRLSSEIKVIAGARATVSVRDYASHAVVVSGLVDSPGRKILRREAMPLYAVLAEALPRPEASLATLVRAGKEESLLLSDEQAMSTLVLPGDIIKVSGNGATQKRFLYVGGDVAAPGEKEFRLGMTLTQALLAAGGVSNGGKNNVRVARRNANGFLVANEYSLKAIADGKTPDPLVEAGDRIEVNHGMW